MTFLWGGCEGGAGSVDGLFLFRRVSYRRVVWEGLL